MPTIIVSKICDQVDNSYHDKHVLRFLGIIAKSYTHMIHCLYCKHS